MASKDSKRGKYAAELAKIREMRALDTILKKGDIENALLTNSSKDSEPVSDTVIDSILNSVNRGKTGEKDLEMLEKLTERGRRSGVKRRSSVSRPKRASRPARSKSRARRRGR